MVTDDSQVLLFTKTSGFDHNTRSESAAMVAAIATSQDFELTVSDDSSVFNDLSELRAYNVIFFTNTSGNTLTAEQQGHVEAYAAQGGHFISNHAASDGYAYSTANSVSGNGKGEWDWYAENVTGCSVRNGPNHTAQNFSATVSIQNQNAALTSGIAFPWADNEEWYYWEDGYLNSSFTEVLRVSNTGSNTYDEPRMTAQLWRRPDGGISFSTSMGHARDKYADDTFVRLIANVFELMLP